MTYNEEIIMELKGELQKFEHDEVKHKIEMDMIVSRKKQIDNIASYMKTHSNPIFRCYGENGGL